MDNFMLSKVSFKNTVSFEAVILRKDFFNYIYVSICAYVHTRKARGVTASCSCNYKKL